MEVAIISFSRNGAMVANRIACALRADGDDVTVSAGFGNPHIDLASWTEASFGSCDALVFVGAAGIATRSIAPFVRHKTLDPAVIVVDELARFCIPLLSGHIGGANDLARRIAAHLDATPVITTATDCNGIFAIDSWAVSQRLSIMNPEAIKTVSSLLLSGDKIVLASEFPIMGETPDGVEFVDAPAAGTAVTSGDSTVSPDVTVGVRRSAMGLRLVPEALVLGAGCKRGITFSELEAAFQGFCDTSDLEPSAIAKVSTIDLKEDEAGLLAFCSFHGISLEVHTAEELNTVSGDFTSSDFVRSVTGTDNVCQRAVVAAGGHLMGTRLAEGGITMAAGLLPVALTWNNVCPVDLPSSGISPSSVHAPRADLAPVSDGTSSADRATASNGKPGSLAVIGLGPGNPCQMTQEALEALKASELICGYPVYIKLAQAVCPHTPTFTTPMTGEIERCRAALQAASEGRHVAMVCSGDAGVYGMASPILELAPEYPAVEVTIVGGITAALSGAAVLGAPLSNDFAIISLSDRLTPWKTIATRLDAAASADLCICLYNPASHTRTDHLRRACDILLRHLAPQTPCGYVRDIGRQGQTATVCTLEELCDATLDMSTTAFIGNSTTVVVGDRLVTPRGYRLLSARPTDADQVAADRVDAEPHIDAELRNDAVPLRGRGTLLLFGGTVEGRMLASELSSSGWDVTTCVATRAGEKILPADDPHIHVMTGRLDRKQMEDLMRQGFSQVVDATHPYAAEATANIRAAARSVSVPYLRLARPSCDCTGCVMVDDLGTACAMAEDGNILATTGTKNIEAYAAIPDYRQRVFARVLPDPDSIAHCKRIGLSDDHILPQTGPFSTEDNVRTITALGIATIITKESGVEGGFPQKVEAARACGCGIIVIRRPADEGGSTYEEVVERLCGHGLGNGTSTSSAACDTAGDTAGDRLCDMAGDTAGDDAR